MMQLPIGNFAVAVVLLICIGFLLGALAFESAAEDEVRQAEERRAYLDAFLKLGTGGLDARQDLISSALESMEDEQKH